MVKAEVKIALINLVSHKYFAGSTAARTDRERAWPIQAVGNLFDHHFSSGCRPGRNQWGEANQPDECPREHSAARRGEGG